MRSTNQRILFLILSLCCLPSVVPGGTNGGRSGYDFLRIETGARASGMGGAFTAMSADIHGLAYNPAGLLGVRDLESSFTYLNYFADMNAGFVGFKKTVDGIGHFGIGVFYMNYGEMRRTDIAGNDQGTFSPADFAMTVAYADSLSMGLRYGGSIRYIQSNIDSYVSRALAADLGLIYHIESQDMNIGIGISNLGGTVDAFLDERERLPTAYRLGVSKRLAHLPLLINLDFIRYQHEESDQFWGLYWALGGEFTITENFFLRGGYNSRGIENKVGNGDDRFAGVSLGIGIQHGKYRFDYAYSSFGAVGHMNTFTVTIPF